jgi:hypothetical protein
MTAAAYRNWRQRPIWRAMVACSVAGTRIADITTQQVPGSPPDAALGQIAHTISDENGLWRRGWRCGSADRRVGAQQLRGQRCVRTRRRPQRWFGRPTLVSNYYGGGDCTNDEVRDRGRCNASTH